MAKIEVTKTELVWPGKYNEDGTIKQMPRVSLPFQVIETINTSRATREAEKKRQPTLFDIYEGKEGDTFEAGWKNKLIWGDNLLVMGSLLEKFAGKIDLIYIDPPFATGADFSFTAEIGDVGLELTKEQSIIEEKAYRDTWAKGIDSFLQMIYCRLILMRDLLSSIGSIYVHVDWRVNHYLRNIMDEVFGDDMVQNEIIWKFSQGGKSQGYWARKHNNIFFYTKTENVTFNSKEVRDPFTPHKRSSTGSYGGRMGIDEDGREYVEKWGTGKKKLYRYYLDEGKIPEDVWEIQSIQAGAGERTGYPTQKPEALLERIIKASSNEGSLVADIFCGSGTTQAVAEKLNRRWIGCDLSRWAMHITRKRLLGIEGCKPFEILNLGKYERQYWQGVTFGGKGKTITEQALYEYLAFMLKLYGAQPVTGLVHLHGKQGRAMVHIGAVDAPVTIDEINAAIVECVQVKQGELHILGWEWEMGLYDLMAAEAKKKGVKLLLLQIPREVMEQQAVDKGDVKFFELAYLEVQIKISKGTRQSAPTTTVTLKNFAIPNTELIPEEVRNKVKKWSDYIDYWAVDWNFQNDTFMQGWVTYRTRKDRTLTLTSDPNTYEKSGKYRILVKVVDIFGNDTSQAFEVEV